MVRGGAWIYLLRIIDGGLGFVRTIIIARLLSPQDFGLLGIAMIALSTMETFSQTGIQEALVQKQEDVESYLDTVWTVSAVRGIILFLILFLSAPIIASFFNSPDAVWVIRVIAVSIILCGLRNIGILFFQKNLEFDRQFAYSLPGTLSDVILSVILALIFRDVWALVFGGLAGNFTRLIMSFWLHPYRPRIKIATGVLKELFGFGRWVLGSSILVFLVTQGDDIFVGKLLGVASLGMYQMAFMLSQLPTTEISHVVSKLTFPAYSKLHDDLARLRQAYLHVLQLTVFMVTPVAFGLFVLASEFVELFLGEKWLQMVPAMQILSFAGLLRSVAATTGPVFLGVGKPKVDTVWQVIRLLVLAVFIYPLAMRWSLLGVSVAVLISISVATWGFCFQVIKIVGGNIHDIGKALIVPFISGLVMVMVILTAKSCLSISGFLQFSMFVILGIFTYAAMTLLFDKLFNYGMVRLVIEKISSY